jgi:hypothetical protein
MRDRKGDQDEGKNRLKRGSPKPLVEEGKEEHIVEEYLFLFKKYFPFKIPSFEKAEFPLIVSVSCVAHGYENQTENQGYEANK